MKTGCKRMCRWPGMASPLMVRWVKHFRITCSNTALFNKDTNRPSPENPRPFDENVLSTHSRLAGLIDFLEQTSTDSIGASSGSWGGYSRCRTISESSEQSEPFRSEDVPGRALALSSRLEMGERSTSVSGGLSVKNCLCLLVFFSPD